MDNKEPISVFIDNCIVSLSETMEGAYKEHDFTWGDSVQRIKVIGYKRKKMPSSDQAWKRDQIECLPTIGRMARENRLSLYTYHELRHEAWRRPGSFSSNNIGNIFDNVKFIDVDAAVERSYFFQMGISEYISKEQVIEFCKWLLTPNIEELANKLPKLKKYPEFLLGNLRGVQRFRDLCGGISEKQYPDAFHLWTAEVNGAELFLTTDRKFIRAITQTKNLKLPCEPLSPSELLEKLGVKERDSFNYSEGQFYNIFGVPN